jgi:hypothetical protein
LVEKIAMYKDAAMMYAEVGVVAVPVNQKKPLVKDWPQLTKADVPNLIGKFPGAGTAVICGGTLTVVDVDVRGADVSRLSSLFAKTEAWFGRTPVVVETPSGGRHYWYKGSGERSRGRLQIDGETVPGDLQGVGRIAVVPDSPGYTFLEGGIPLIPKLPRIREGSISLQPDLRAPAARLNEMGDGDGRNAVLFRLARAIVGSVGSRGELLDRISALNNKFAEPLPKEEVVDMVDREWRRIQGDPNGRRARPYVMIFNDELDNLSDNALVLLMDLRRLHGWRKGGEFILANAMSDRLGWSPHKFRDAVNELDGIAIEITNKGGRGLKDPRKGRLLSSEA